MINKNIFKKTLTAAAIVAGLSAVQVAEAANWLMLQGTERNDAAGRAKVWGFIQPEYQSTDGTTIQDGYFKGEKAIFNQIRPDLDTQSDLNVLRARIGVRGIAMPIDSNVNYFFLAESGNNPGTRYGNAGSGGMIMTDASVTLNNIKGARIRIGQFKAPLGDEALQAIHVMDYINFSNVTNGLMLERFFDGDGSGTFVKPTLPSPTVGNSGEANLMNGQVGAFRDVGIQVFDAFKIGDIEHSYAVMSGNGNGVNRSDNDLEKDAYLYYSIEKVFGGKGPKREGLKAYLWNVDGRRTLTTEGAGTYDRKRSGFGMTYRQGKQRAAFEYISAEGMIFTGSDLGAVPGTTVTKPPGTALASFNVAINGKADGYYLHYGYAVMPNVELDIRHDVYNRETDSVTGERVFTTTTLGAQYWLNKKSHLTFNYEMRGAEAPGLAATHAANVILDGMDDRISLGLLTIF